MYFKNVSGIVRTSGSDIDLQIAVGAWLWLIVSRVLIVHDRQVRLVIGSIELFIVPLEVPGTRAMAAAISRAIQESWDRDTREAYRMCKLQIAHLRGVERKYAKAHLARTFGLPTPQYKPHS